MRIPLRPDGLDERSAANRLDASLFERSGSSKELPPRREGRTETVAPKRITHQ
jgi:hypothetical protein